MRHLPALLGAAAFVPLLAGAAAADDQLTKKDPTPPPAGPVSGPSGVGGSAGAPAGPLGPYAGPVGATRSWTACGGPTARSVLCASVWVEVSGFFTTVRVQNLSGSAAANRAAVSGGDVESAGRWVLTTVGFDGLPSAVSALVAYSTTGDWWERTARPRSWVAFNDGQFGGGERIDVGIDNGAGISGGIASSCAPAGTLPGGSNRLWMTPNPDCPGYDVAATAYAPAGDWFETRLVTTAAWDPNADGVALYLKGQSGPGGASYECLVGGATPRGDCYAADFSWSGGGVGAVVPEPQTVLLFGTGLAGLAVAALRRRHAELSVDRR